MLSGIYSPFALSQLRCRDSVPFFLQLRFKTKNREDLEDLEAMILAVFVVFAVPIAQDTGIRKQLC